jgi:hypothetical protein
MKFARKGRQAQERAVQKRLQLRRFFRPRLESLEDRIAPTVNLISHYPGLDFNQSGGFTPPDSNGAAGPTNEVETVNQTVAIYNPKSSGSSAITAPLSTFFFTNGGLSPVASGSSQTDPFTIYDPLVQRFIVGDLDFKSSADKNQLLLAVSKNSSPQTLTTNDWFFYTVNTTEKNIVLQDYPGNPGYNADALVVTLNSFNASSAIAHVLVTSISMKALVSGAGSGGALPGADFFENDVANAASLRPTAMQDSKPGDPMWLIEQNPNGTDNSINVLKMTGVLSAAPTFTTTTLPVNPYIDTINQPALQPGGSAITGPGFTDSRILNAAEMNNTIVATHAVGNLNRTEDDAQWYAINVSSGTPVIQQEGDVSAGNNTYLSYPAITINSAGDFGMTYMMSGTGAGQFLSMYVTGRTPSDPAGTMETPVLAEAGQAIFSAGGRAGDLSGINVDPLNGTFWAVSEFANMDPTYNWGTGIANFGFSVPPPPPGPPPPPPGLPPLLPIYALDSVPGNPLFFSLQKALTNFVDAEFALLVALAKGDGSVPAATSAFETALTQYFRVLTEYELTLPPGG